VRLKYFAISLTHKTLLATDTQSIQSAKLSETTPNVQTIEILASLRLLGREACLKIGSQGSNDYRDRLFVGQLADRRVVEHCHIDEPHFQSLSALRELNGSSRSSVLLFFCIGYGSINVSVRQHVLCDVSHRSETGAVCIV
jgi:hypothetical protein